MVGVFHRSKGSIGSFSPLEETSSWSDWEWDEEYHCYRRSRSHNGKQESEYETQATPRSIEMPIISCTAPNCLEGFTGIEARDRHYKDVHSNSPMRPYVCAAIGCKAGVKSWTSEAGLRKHNNTWHGPYHCVEVGCSRQYPNGFKTNRELVDHNANIHGGPAASVDRWGPPSFPSSSEAGQANDTSTRLSDTQNDDLSLAESNASSVSRKLLAPKARHDVSLGKKFKVHKSDEFVFGRIFKVMWSEPFGAFGARVTPDSVTSSFGGKIHQKIRRFLIIDSKPGHSQCLAIMTYGGQGTSKPGVRPEDHAVIYSSRDGPLCLAGEPPMYREAIKCAMTHPDEQLNPASRLNYAKVYTVEHNVKVLFVGRVTPTSAQEVVDNYNEVHPSLPDRPEAETEEEYRSADRGYESLQHSI